jgi:hypothetical protein
MKENFGEKS